MGVGASPFLHSGFLQKRNTAECGFYRQPALTANERSLSRKRDIDYVTPTQESVCDAPENARIPGPRQNPIVRMVPRLIMEIIVVFHLRST